jgi:hypothetical protein
MGKISGGAVQICRVAERIPSPPALPAPPPQTPPACSRQERTGLSKRQRSARTRGSHAELAKLGLPPQQDCTVGTALAFKKNILGEVFFQRGGGWRVHVHTVSQYSQS